MATSDHWKNGSGMVKDQGKGMPPYGKLGIILGAMVVIVSIVWVTLVHFCHRDHGGNEVTWVG
jgi:hypothetical protein